MSSVTPAPVRPRSFGPLSTATLTSYSVANHMADHPDPLRDDELREMLQDVHQLSFGAYLNVLAFQRLLVKNGYLKEADIAAEIERLRSELQGKIPRTIQ